MDDRPKTLDKAAIHDVWNIASPGSGTRPGKVPPEAPAPNAQRDLLRPPAGAPVAADAQEPVARADSKTEARAPTRTPQDGVALEPAEQAPGRPRSPGRPARLARSLLRLMATVLIFAAAVVAALIVWAYYVTAPWTRDGRVRVQVASVAPQVSGQITEVRIVDNQFVHKGDILYVIDPFDFRISLATAKSQVQQRAADLQVKRVQAERRQHLSDLATTAEEQQQYVGNATQAQAAFEAAQAQEAQAEINLKRTMVTSPVNGFVTNLLMRVGDFAHEGSSNVSVIDADSYWIDGYFEETKMAHVCVGDRAEAKLIGYAQPILGRVQSVTRGISVSDATAGTQGLPNVDAVYTWVRLAQRVPVRVAIDSVPEGVPLVSGMTATVSIRDAAPLPAGSWLNRKLVGVETGVRDLVDRPTPRPDCVPAIGGLEGRTVLLPTPEPTPPRGADQINPGLTPGMTKSPRPQ